MKVYYVHHTGHYGGRFHSFGVFSSLENAQKAVKKTFNGIKWKETKLQDFEKAWIGKDKKLTAFEGVYIEEYELDELQ